MLETTSWFMIGTILLIALHDGTAEYANKLLLISMDGFRWDYLDRVTHKPNFERMIREGVKAPYINNAFITKTFPDHYTLVTGLYEESHGIVGNSMYDPVFNETFKIYSHGSNSKWWSAGEPIWITAVKQGLKSGTFFWPGSESEIDGKRPTFWKPYDKSVVYRTRVDTVRKWFTDESLNAVTLYFSEPDGTGHKYGPGSDFVLGKIEDLDAVLGYLLDTFEKEGILDKVNIILTSDHGMANMDASKKVVDFSQYLNVSALIQDLPEVGPLCQIIPKPNKTMEIYNALKDAHPNMTVYLKEDIPERWHFKNNRRVQPIVAIVDEGWNCAERKSRIYRNKGAHGYDNMLMSMKPFFLARGPNFKANFKSEPFNAVDVYPLMCKLLKVNPAPNNGSLTTVSKFIQDTATSKSAMPEMSLLLVLTTLVSHVAMILSA